MAFASENRSGSRSHSSVRVLVIDINVQQLEPHHRLSQVGPRHRGSEVARYPRGYEQGVWLPPPIMRSETPLASSALSGG